MIDQIKNELGVHLDLKVNCRSDVREDVQACVTYGFGINKIPTHEQIDAAIDECIAQFNSAAGVSDGRLTRLSDFGLADVEGFDWKRCGEES